MNTIKVQNNCIYPLVLSDMRVKRGMMELNGMLPERCDMKPVLNDMKLVPNDKKLVRCDMMEHDSFVDKREQHVEQQVQHDKRLAGVRWQRQDSTHVRHASKRSCMAYQWSSSYSSLVANCRTSARHSAARK